jgi:hypothetical protein
MEIKRKENIIFTIIGYLSLPTIALNYINEFKLFLQILASYSINSVIEEEEKSANFEKDSISKMKLAFMKSKVIIHWLKLHNDSKLLQLNRSNNFYNSNNFKALYFR